MPKFLEEINVAVPGGLRALSFKATEDMRLWLNAEEPFWKDLDIRFMQHNLRNIWNAQQNFYVGVRQCLQQFETAIEANQGQVARQHNEALRNLFTQVENGRVITSDYAIFPAVVDVARVNIDAAGLLYLLARSDAASTLGTFSNQGVQFKTLLDLILLYTRSKGTKDWLLPQRKELTGLKIESQAALNDIRIKCEEQNKAIEDQRRLADDSHESRTKEWSAFKEELGEEWSALKNVYDEKLALLAPTQYWGDRAKSHRNVAIAFAVAFGVVLIASIGIFAWLAMPHLFVVAANRETSPILTLIPIAIPAFAGIWVLKMLSRLLSENLQMMRDARERETMVKTFLALMRDDTTGKTLIKDDDRILILHSLFRPSSVTAADDAPPVHWFDLLTSKLASSKVPGK